MLKKIFALIALLLLVLPLRVNAQQPVSFTKVQVRLWPEFDRAEMLVIYDITLAPEVKLPVDISLRIPAAAKEPNAVAAGQPDGSLFNIPYAKVESGDWLRIDIQVTAPILRLEYYDPGLSIDGQDRHFAFHWPGDYVVNTFLIEVQNPAGASGMRISPSLGEGKVGSDGLAYYSADWGALGAGQSFDITLDYQKASDDLTSSSMPVEPSGPIDESALGRQRVMPALPWILGIFGLLLIVGGVVWYWQSGRQQAKPGGQRSRHKPSPQVEQGVPEGGNIYCHQCGKRALPGDRFCRACGTQLRLG